MTRTLRALLVEDSPDDEVLLVHALEKHGYEPAHRRVDSRQGLQEALAEQTWDVVLIDFTLPSLTGVEALKIVRETGQRPGLVIVSGTISEEAAVGALSAGAHDYVLKDNLKRLGPAVDHAVREARQQVRQAWAEAELRRSEEKYRQLHQSMRDGFLRVDMEGRILETNPAFQTMLGYEAEELVALDYRTLIPEAGRGREAEVFAEQVIPLGYSDVYENEYQRKDGTILPVEVRRVLLRDAEGSPVSVWSTVRGITERKRAERQLERERALLRTLIDNLPDAIYFKDSEGRFITCNAAFLKNLGVAKLEDIEGRTGFDFFPPGVFERFSTREREVLQSGIPLLDHEETVVRDGATKWFLVAIVPLRDSTGAVAGIVGVSRDITDRKALEIQLLQAQKMEAVGQLAGGIAHDFNNLLTAIIGFATFLQIKLKDNEPLRHNADQIIGASEKAAQLTRSLLAFSRKQIINPKPVDVNGVIREMEKLLLRIIGEDIELRTDLAEGQLVVLADTGQIEQVLLNLATNARDAMPEGGSLIISTARLLVDDAFIRSHGYGKAGMHAVISFEDTGVGMEKATLGRIFEPFFTTKDVGKGTGLGLSTVYGIVKQHDGYINAYSEPGRGTTLRIYLPVADAAPAEPAPKRPAQPTGGHETILLGEDDPDVRRLTRMILEEAGYEVIEAVDGDDAVARFEQNRDRVQLVILDIIMPRKSGKAVSEEIHASSPGVRFLFTSGYTANIIHHKGILEEGFNFMTKPFSPHALLAKIREILDQ